MYLDEITDWVAVTHDTGISIASIQRLISDAGITYKVLRRAASERDELARDEWRQYIRSNFVSSLIVTVDESSKDGRTIFRKRGRAPRGQRAEISADFVRGDRYSIIATLTVNGYIGTQLCPDLWTARSFLTSLLMRVYVLVCYRPCLVF